MPALDLTLVNAALTRTGTAPPLSATTGGSAAEGIVLNNYEQTIRSALAGYPWKFATKIDELDRLDPTVHGDPPEPWQAAYQLPVDLLDLRTVMVSGFPIFYAVHGDKILCNVNESDQVIAHYLWRVPEVSMPPWFAEWVIITMEVMFLRGIGERYDEADAREKKALFQWGMAKNRDAQSQSPRDPTVSPTLLARGGFWPVTTPFPWR
jgi:hypothetical protein